MDEMYPRFCKACEFMADAVPSRATVTQYPQGSRVKKAPEFLPLMMIDPLRDNFHIIFFIFSWQRENVRKPAINSAALRPSAELLFQQYYILIANLLRAINRHHKRFLFFIVKDEHRVFIARLLPANAFILANRAISDKLVSPSGGIRAIHVKRLLNYSPVYAISFAPLTELTRFAINRVLQTAGQPRLHFRTRQRRFTLRPEPSRGKSWRIEPRSRVYRLHYSENGKSAI